MAQLAGMRALVTGGGRGIGRAIAAALTRAGAEVVIAARSAETLAEVVEAGEAASARSLDIAIPGATAALIERLLAEGPLDILVNNAGSARGGSFERQTRGDLKAMMAEHVLAPAEAMRAVLPGMKQRGFGRIVNMGSTAGLRGYSGVSSYVAAKHAALGLTRAVAAETAKTGVTVNAVCPGYVETDMLRAGVTQRASKTGQDPDAAFASFAAAQPLGRLIKPEEVASAVLWLCSREAAAVTGQAVVVDAAEGV